MGMLFGGHINRHEVMADDFGLAAESCDIFPERFRRLAGRMAVDVAGTAPRLLREHAERYGDCRIYPAIGEIIEKSCEKMLDLAKEFVQMEESMKNGENLEIKDVPEKLRDMLGKGSIDEILEKGALDLHEVADCSTTPEDAEEITRMSDFLFANMEGLRRLEGEGAFRKEKAGKRPGPKA